VFLTIFFCFIKQHSGQVFNAYSPFFLLKIEFKHNVEDTFGLNFRRITFKIIDAKTIILDNLILRELVWVWVLEFIVDRKYKKN